MENRLLDIKHIAESYINGQFKQAVSQLKAFRNNYNYTMRETMALLIDYLNPEQRLKLLTIYEELN